MPGRQSNFEYTEENPEIPTPNNYSGRTSNTIALYRRWLYDRSNAPVPGEVAPPPDPNDATPAGSMNDYTATLYALLLGLMDQQANTDLANSQISQLSSILSQRSALAGKDLAAGTFAAGGATAANISGILRGEQQALGQGITEIQGQALARSDANKAQALNMILSLRGQLSMEQQADFDNRMRQAQFDFEKWKTKEGFRLAEEEQEAQGWSFIVQAIDAIIPG